MCAKKCEMEAGEMRRTIDAYFQALEEDPGKRGGPSDLLAALRLSMEQAESIVRSPGTRYREQAGLLLEAATRLRGHLETSPAWAGSNSTKAVFLAKQILWDGKGYLDKQEGKRAGGEVKVVFGSEGKRAFE